MLATNANLATNLGGGNTGPHTHPSSEITDFASAVIAAASGLLTPDGNLSLAPTGSSRLVRAIPTNGAGNTRPWTFGYNYLQQDTNQEARLINVGGQWRFLTDSSQTAAYLTSAYARFDNLMSVGVGGAPTLSALDVQSTSGAQQALRYSASAYAKSTVDNFGILSIHGTAGYYYWRNAGDTANMLELYTNSGDTYLRHNLSGHNLYMSSLGTILFQAGGSYVLNLASDHILHRYGTLLKFESVTASATQSQGQGPLSGANFVRITTCATANDAITLSGSTIWSSVNSTRPLFIYNDGAETCQVFPPSGFDLGQGTNNSDTIAAGALAIFVSTSANTLVRFL